MKIRSLLPLFLAAAATSAPAAPLKLNGTFEPDKTNPEMPLNWTQNKGNWFKPYGIVKYLASNQLQVITNDQKSVYLDESTRFPAAPDGILTLGVNAKGKGKVGFLVHLYNEKGNLLTTLTSAFPVKENGGTVKISYKLNAEYAKQTPKQASFGIFIEKISDVILSDFQADYTVKAPNPARMPQTRSDWAAGTYKMLTERAAKEQNIPLMFLGDSITQLWEFSPKHQYPGGLDTWNRIFKPMNASNYGVSGDMIQNVLWRITEGRQLAAKPAVIVLLIGTNNLHQNPKNTPEEIVDGVDNLLKVIRKELPETKILLLGILPRQGNHPIAQINQKLAWTAKKNQASFLDVGPILLRGKANVEKEIFRDGLHLSPAGYELFAESILPEIRRLTAAKENADRKLPEKKSEYKLYLSKDAVVSERKAAEEFQYFFGRIFGETPEIVSEMPDGDKVILIGQSREVEKMLPDVDFRKLKTDEIILRDVNGRLILTGARPRGSLYAVYTFLEDRLGTRFYTSFEQETPSLKNFKVPKIHLRYAPVIKARGSFFHDLLYTDQLFAIRQRNNEDFLKNKKEYGCEINFVGGVHTFNRLIPAHQYLKTHPEFFSLRGGERVGGQLKGQLCLSNEDMRKELTKNLLAFLRKNPQATMVSVSQNDNTLFCECRPCLEESQKEGSPAGPMLRFVNQVAADVEKEFPNVTVQTFAYQYTSTPPKFARPRHNVEVRLCSIGSNFAAPLDSPNNAPFRREIREWSKIAPRLSVWNYVANFSNYLRPFPNLAALAEDIRSFGKYNICAVLEQGDWNSGGVTGDFVALKAYVISKLLWNPSLEPKNVINEFIDGYYGAAAPQIREYLEQMEQEVKKNDTYLGCFTAHIDKILSLESVLEGYRLMLKAEDAVKEKDFKFRERVKIAGLPIRLAMLERAVPLKKKYGNNAPDLNAVFLEAMAIAKRNRTNLYNETRPFTELEKDLRARVDKAMTLKPGTVKPAECTKNLKPGTFWEIQDITKQVADPAASDGSASRETGKVYTWSLQFPPSLDNFPMKPGKYRIIASFRAELNDGAAADGNGAEGGSYDLLKKKITEKNIPLKALVGKEYQEFDLGIHELNPNCYIYIAPKKNAAMKYLYLDRIIVIQAD